MVTAPRSTEQRCRDTRQRLQRDIDAWVATAGPDGAWLVPLSFVWHGDVLVLGTAADSRTVRNLAGTPGVRIGLGATRDVIMIDGDTEVVATTTLDPVVADAFAGAAGFDPRELTDYVYVRVTPLRIQAWREENEIRGRTIMQDGVWLA